MKLKSILRQTLLLPLWPHVFLLELRLLRLLGLLPPVSLGNWPPQRVLIVNLTVNLGDTLMMLPTVDALKRVLPNVEIDLVVGAPMAAPMRSVPSIRRVFAFDAGKTSIPLLSQYLQVSRMFRFARRELADTYDLALLPRWGTDPFLSHYLAAMSNAPVRAGHDPADEYDASAQSMPGFTALMTSISRGGQGVAEAVREQRILAACGILGQLDQDAEERRPVDSVLQMAQVGDAAQCMHRLGIDAEQAFILLSPGASHPARRWPADRFAELGHSLKRTWGVAVYIIGGPGDRDIGREIETRSQGSVLSLVGKTSVLEAIALTQKAALLVTNDSGPAHVGGSLGIPTLVLSVCPLTSTQEHANSPRRVRPVGPQVRVLQPQSSASGCGERCLVHKAHCILGIGVDTVLRNAEQMLAASLPGKAASHSTGGAADGS